MELDRGTPSPHSRPEISQAGAGGEPLETQAPRLDLPAADTESPDDWSRQSPSAIVCHVIERFHDPLRQRLSELALTVEQVRTEQGHGQAPDFDQIAALFRALHWELLLHIEREERVLFPLITRLDEALRSGASTLPPIALEAPISQMESARAETAQALGQMRRITDDFTTPLGAGAAVQALYRRLRELEDETRRHVLFEAEVLFPRTLALAANRVA